MPTKDAFSLDPIFLYIIHEINLSSSNNRDLSSAVHVIVLI